MARLYYIFIFLLGFVAVGTSAIFSSPRLGHIRAVSLFTAEEADLNKYAAVLATAEPLRHQCELEIKRAMTPVGYFFHKLRGAPFPSAGGANAGVDLACKRFEGKLQDLLA